MRTRFETAVAEIAANVVRHAYPRGSGRGLLRLRLHAHPGMLRAEFEDDGLPYRPPEPLSPPRPPVVAGAADGAGEGDRTLEIPESGYGLALARAVADELAYERSAAGVNRWVLVKNFDPALPGPLPGVPVPNPPF